MIIEQLTELDEIARQGASITAEMSRAITGLESQIRETISRLDRPRSPGELQGLAEFLLMAASSLRSSCDRQRCGMEALGMITAHHLAAFREMGLQDDG